MLTNLHVLEEIGRRFPDVVVRSGQGFQILDDVYIDFVRETGTARTNRFRVVEATPSRTDPADKARLDAAVLRIEPTEPGQVVPQAIPLLPDVDGPLGNLEPAYLIGFPGPPSFFGRGDDDVNWTKVYQVLFGNRYGVKRLAPGKVNEPLGSLDRDPGKWIFGHDATTLGGSSGLRSSGSSTACSRRTACTSRASPRWSTAPTRSPRASHSCAPSAFRSRHERFPRNLADRHLIGHADPVIAEPEG